MLMKTPLFLLFIISSLCFSSCATNKNINTENTKEHMKISLEKPNCVSSLVEKDSSHFISAIAWNKEEHPFKSLIPILENFRRGEILIKEENYIHFIERSFLFSFIDDVEFTFKKEDRVIHISSGARSGYYDFGVNRNRLEKIRKILRK